MDHTANHVTRRDVLAAFWLGLAAGLGLPGLPALAGQGRLDGREAGLIPGSSADQSAALRRAIRMAQARNAVLVLPAGAIFVKEIDVRGPVRISGMAGARLVCAPGGDYLLACQGGPVALSNIAFDGAGATAGGEQDGLVRIARSAAISIRHCAFTGGADNGLALEGCSGVVEACRFLGHGRAALFSLNGHKLRVTGNVVRDCANNGILVWQDAKRFDGTLISGNRIENIGAEAGGDGQNGNGVNVFRAGGVTVADNVIRHCAYSAVRNNSGDDCRILRNDCRDIGEVAIFVEFAFRNVEVDGNRIARASAGVSITNADHGGRLARVTDNIIRDIAPRISSPDVLGYGIWAERETLVSGNLVERAQTAGLWLGWGKYLDRVTAQGNILRDCGTGIAVSFAPGAGEAVITGNIIERPRFGAIMGFDHEKPVTGDLLAPGAKIPARLKLSANVSG